MWLAVWPGPKNSLAHWAHIGGRENGSRGVGTLRTDKRCGVERAKSTCLVSFSGCLSCHCPPRAHSIIKGHTWRMRIPAHSSSFGICSPGTHTTHTPPQHTHTHTRTSDHLSFLCLQLVGNKPNPAPSHPESSHRSPSARTAQQVDKRWHCTQCSTSENIFSSSANVCVPVSTYDKKWLTLWLMALWVVSFWVYDSTWWPTMPFCDPWIFRKGFFGEVSFLGLSGICMWVCYELCW